MKAQIVAGGADGPMDGTLFTKSRKAAYWNDFYLRPANVFEYTMVQRRDYAHRYVCERFPKDAALLDLGCGAGVLSDVLLGSGYRVTCADASEDMLDLTRARLASAPSQPEAVVRADIMNLPFEDASFDVVVCMGVFGYFDDVDRALSEVRRVLKPGGTFFMSIRNTYNLYLCELERLPFRMARFAGKALWGKLGGRKAALSTQPKAATANAQSSHESAFRIDIHTDPRPVIAGITRRGFSLLEFDGLGYGPLKLFGKDFLPPSWSMKLNDLLNAYFRRTGLHQRTRWLADVSFYVFRKEP